MGMKKMKTEYKNVGTPPVQSIFRRCQEKECYYGDGQRRRTN
jgi:hypothetical protein